MGGTGGELVEDGERTLAPGLEGDSRLEGEEGEEGASESMMATRRMMKKAKSMNDERKETGTFSSR